MLDPQIVIVGRPTVDFVIFLSAANKVLGRSISKSVDSYRFPTKNVSVLICYLTEMLNSGSIPSLKNAGALLRHLSYSLVIRSSFLSIFDLLSNSSISVSSAECSDGTYLSYASGNLEEWREAIINSCSDSSSIELRLLFDRILLTFEKEGLSDVFSDYRKVNLPDKTFRLEQK